MNKKTSESKINICKYCKKPFTKNHPSQKFCCDQCRWNYWNKKQHTKNKRLRNKGSVYYVDGIPGDSLDFLLYMKEIQGEMMSEESIQGEL